VTEYTVVIQRPITDRMVAQKVHLVDPLRPDAFAWFKDRFHIEEEPTEEPFDVIIMDAL
jgi:hypothetical protein